MAWMAYYCRRTDRLHRSPEEGGRGCQERGLHRHSVAWHGWVEFVSRRFCTDLWEECRLPAAARTRFDRSCASQGNREKDQSGKDTLRGFEQIGYDPRTQHLQTILLRSRKESRRRKSGRKPIHRNYRSGIENAKGRGS